MGKTLQIDVADDVLVALERDSEELAREMRLAAAVKWYELGRISQDKAAEVAGMSREMFLMVLGQFSVSPFQETADEIREAALAGPA